MTGMLAWCHGYDEESIDMQAREKKFKYADEPGYTGTGKHQQQVEIIVSGNLSQNTG